MNRISRVSAVVVAFVVATLATLPAQAATVEEVGTVLAQAGQDSATVFGYVGTALLVIVAAVWIVKAIRSAK